MNRVTVNRHLTMKVATRWTLLGGLPGTDAAWFFPALRSVRET